MVMAEKRYARKKVFDKLPKWIKKMMSDSSVDISTSLCTVIAKNFYREMDKEFALDPRTYFTPESFRSVIAEVTAVAAI
jgi:hypothetical protein